MFNRKDLEDVLINSILNGSGLPDRSTSTAFKRKRFNRCARAILSRNLLIPVTAKQQVISKHDVVVGYSNPLETDVMCWGFTWTQTQIEPFDFGRTLKLSINGHEIISNVAVGQRTLSGPYGGSFGNEVTGYGTSDLPVPIRIPAGSRVAAEFSFNPSTGYDADNASANLTQYDSIVLLCIAVKSCLDDEDRELLRRCREWIDGHEFQVPVILNSVSSPTDSNLNIFWDGPNGGGGLDVATTSETRNISAPLMVRAFASNLALSRFAIRDSRNHSFMPNGMVLAQNFTSYKGGFPIASQYFRFLVPHVLAAGAQLVTDHLDGTGANVGIFSFDGRAFAPADDELPHQNWLAFHCVTP